MGNSIISKILAFFMSIFVAIGNLFGFDVQTPETDHVHSYDIVEITREPTCAEIGIQTSSCACGAKIEEYIDVLGHDIQLIKEKAPTCTEAGLTAGVFCAVCGETLVAQESVPAMGHTEATDKAVAATCTTAGKTEGKHCSVCNEVLKAQEIIPAKGHTEVTDKAVAATCTTAGKTEGKHCSVCNEVIKAQVIIPAKGHTPVADAAVPPTCTENGLTEGSHCSVCNTVLKAQIAVPAKGHTEVTDKAVAATCTTAGKTEGKHCSVCNTVLKAQETVPVTGHNGVLDESTVIEVTCAREGYTGDYKCTVCGEITATGVTVPADTSRHAYELTTYEPTCTIDEYTIMQCIYCNDIDLTTREETGRYPDGIGHSFGTVTTVAPTCVDEGYDTKTCSECTYEERSNFKDATGHKYGMAPDKNGKLDPTCQTAGYKKYTCKNADCGYVRTDIVDIVPCNTDIAVVKHGTKTADGEPTDYCYTEYSCSFCNEVVSTVENYGAHSMIMTAVSSKTCTTPAAKYMACEYCSYENIVVIEEAPGHTCSTVQPPTCTDDGFIATTGICDVCGEILDGEIIVLPAKGHKLTGVQTCTTAVTCENCGETTAPSLGHSFTKTSPAVANSADKSVTTFFCTRCGVDCEDKIAAFNALTDRIKFDFYGKYDYTNGYPKLHRFIKTSAENTLSNINFGIYTSIVRDMVEEEMSGTPVTYDRITKMSVIGALPIYAEDYVSLLGAGDVDSITLERVSGLDFSKVLSGFDDKFTSGNTEYDASPYKAMKVEGNVIKVTIDVKNEKYYGGIELLPAAEQTSLQKIFGTDVREQLFSDSSCSKDCPENCAEHHYVKGGDGKLYMETSQYSMLGQFFAALFDQETVQCSEKMMLNDMSTDGKVTYYFLEETYEPIAAVYEETETMNQHMETKINVGLVIKGTMDTLSKTNSVTVYVFPSYLPAV